MSDTIFSKIIRREIPASFLHEDDHCVVIRDIHPLADTHLLVIPKKPVPRLGDAGEADAALLGHLLVTARKVAEKQGLVATGFRVVINSGPDAGETIPHLHVHVLGGQPLGGFGA